MKTFKALPIALFLLVPAAVSAEPAPAAAYKFLFAGNPAGTATTRTVSDREWIATFELNDRGRGPSTTTRWTLDGQGLPVRTEITGHDYWKTPVDERFERTAAKASWTNASEREERTLDHPAFYTALNGPPQETEVLARALLRAPEGRIALLPTGEARIERVLSRQVTSGGETRALDLYAISGGGFTPGYFWLDDQKRLFAQIDGWATLVREGWEGVTAELLQAQEAKVAEREREQAQRLARHPAAALAIRHARLFDPETGTVRPDTTVVISGNRIAAVGRDGEVQVPQGAEGIDAGGKLLMPGLWDMHVHLVALDGILHLAAGVTSVRDLANDTDQLLDLRRRFDAGETLGPRVLMAGFIDGPGPYAGPTKVLVDTPEEALAAVDRYHELGYVQIKMYSSLDPKLVPPIIERAHGYGMRRELELYAKAGIPAPEILKIATLGAARVMKRDGELGTIAPGKLADLILVDGDPTVRISDIQRVTLTIKDGVVYDPAALYATIGVKPAV